MAGYLEQYGVQEVRRGRVVKKIILGTLVTALAGLLLWLYFRNFTERRAANAFLDAVKSHDYAKAYQTWGCSEAKPCRDYNFQRFLQDWGPDGIYKRATEGSYSIEDACGAGVMFTLEIPGTPEPVGIWVNRSDKVVSFAPWARCPGRHLHLWEFIKSKL